MYNRNKHWEVRYWGASGDRRVTHALWVYIKCTSRTTTVWGEVTGYIPDGIPFHVHQEVQLCGVCFRAASRERQAACSKDVHHRVEMVEGRTVVMGARARRIGLSWAQSQRGPQRQMTPKPWWSLYTQHRLRRHPLG